MSLGGLYVTSALAGANIHRVGATKNYVELPTVFRSGKLEIKVWGEVTVDINYKANSIEGT